MRNHALVQLFYRFLDLFVRDLLLLVIALIGRSIVLLLALGILYNRCGLVNLICCFYIGRMYFPLFF
jgi:hypothetical protein